jgi:hypothetical protein
MEEKTNKGGNVLDFAGSSPLLCLLTNNVLKSLLVKNTNNGEKKQGFGCSRKQKIEKNSFPMKWKAKTIYF